VGNGRGVLGRAGKRQLFLLGGLASVLHRDPQSADSARIGGGIHVLVVAGKHHVAQIVSNDLPATPARPRVARDPGGHGWGLRCQAVDGAIDGVVPVDHPLRVGSVARRVRSPLQIGSVVLGQLLVVGRERGLVVVPVGLIGVEVRGSESVGGRLSATGDGAVWKMIDRCSSCLVVDRDVVDCLDAPPITARSNDLHGDVPTVDHRAVLGEVTVLRWPTEVRFRRGWASRKR